MNKQEFVAVVAEKTGLTKTDAEKAVNAFMDGVLDATAQGDSVVLTGFGTFSVAERAARTGKNPRTGETVAIAAKKVPKFKAGKKLKDAAEA